MIYETLCKIQAALKAPKNQYNKFGNYNYRNCEDILEALKPLLSENKACVTLSDEMVILENRFYVKATATFIQGGENVSVSAYAREDEAKKGMDGSQITGSASSYARKYALNGLFAIDDTKDSDSTNNASNGTNNGSNTTNKASNDVSKLNARRTKEVKELAANAGQSNEDIAKWIAKKYNDPDLNLYNISEEQYAELTLALKKAAANKEVA